MKTIGVIGLGIIGSVWARHYAAAGVLSGAWNRTPQPDFPKWTPDIAGVARGAAAVQIVVADPPAVAAVLDPLIPALAAGTLVIQSSTIDPASSERCCERVLVAGGRYLEAPFVGSKPAAEAKKNTFYLGGDSAVMDAAECFLSLVSERRFRIGLPRQAAALKLATNMNVALQMEALGEILVFARRAGITDEQFFEVLAHHATCSPFLKLKEAKLRARDFSPQFSVKHLLKDMRLAEGAKGTAALPLLTSIREQLERAAGAGLAEEDMSALIRLLESPS